MQSPIAIVQSIYAAFGQGDIGSILSHLADDIAWESWSNNFAQIEGVPWLRGGKGKSNVVEFFRVVEKMQIHDFQVLDMLASERQVAVEVVIEVTVANGVRFRDEEMHLWTVDLQTGKVVRMRHYVDTAKQVKASQSRA